MDSWRCGTFRPVPYLSLLRLGGFETGDSSDPSNTAFVQRSIDIGQPILLVTANYRLSGKKIRHSTTGILKLLFLAFGFLGGKEVAAAGVANLGIHDRKTFSIIPIFIAECHQKLWHFNGYKIIYRRLAEIPPKSHCWFR